MPVYISIVAARRVAGDNGTLAAADLVLDEVVELHGVTVEQSWPSGAYLAVPPRRPFGDHRPVLSWSGAVGRDIAQAVLARLNGRAAVAGPEQNGAAAEALRALLEPEPTGAELPEDPPEERPDPALPGRERVRQAIEMHPGAEHDELAGLTGLAVSSVRSFASRLVIAGSARREHHNGRVTYWPAPELDEPPGMGPSSGAVRAPAPTAPATPSGGRP